MGAEQSHDAYQWNGEAMTESQHAGRAGATCCANRGRTQISQWVRQQIDESYDEMVPGKSAGAWVPQSLSGLDFYNILYRYGEQNNETLMIEDGDESGLDSWAVARFEWFFPEFVTFDALTLGIRKDIQKDAHIERSDFRHAVSGLIVAEGKHVLELVLELARITRLQREMLSVRLAHFFSSLDSDANTKPEYLDAETVAKDVHEPFRDVLTAMKAPNRLDAGLNCNEFVAIFSAQLMRNQHERRDKFFRALYKVTHKTYADNPNPEFRELIARLATMASVEAAEDDDERAIAGIARKHLLKYQPMIGYIEFSRETITNIILDDILAQERQVRRQVEDFVPILFHLIDEEDEFQRYGMLTWTELDDMLKLPSTPEMESVSQTFIKIMQGYTGHGIDCESFVAALLPVLMDNRHGKETVTCLELQWFMTMIQGVETVIHVGQHARVATLLNRVTKAEDSAESVNLDSEGAYALFKEAGDNRTHWI